MVAKKRRTAARSRKAVSRATRSTKVSRRKSHFRVVARPVRSRFSDRFQRFYYLHRDDLNKHRRAEYQRHKRSGACVKCSSKRSGKSIFCAKHLRLSRVYNRRR